MPRLDINNAQVSDYSSIGEYSIEGKNVDSVLNQDETIWQNQNWKEEWGAFCSVAEYQNALLMKGIWNTGKGWTADAKTEMIAKNITGWGKDTFDDIIFNADVISMAGGDSYAQIILDEKKERIINLKPLSPELMRIVVSNKGRIKRYEQYDQTQKKLLKTFQPNEIFHLCYNRLADQIHGISKYQTLKKIILAEEESFEIIQKVMRFQARPFIIFKMKTDDVTKINSFISKIKDVRKKGEDLFIPDDENLLSWEVVQLSPSQLIMEWRNDLRNKFYRAVGLPQIVPGGGGQSTESESRVIYLAFEQLVAQRQLYLENQIWSQLGLKIKFNPPTTMAELIGKDQAKDAGSMDGVRPSEINPTSTRQ